MPAGRPRSSGRSRGPGAPAARNHPAPSEPRRITATLRGADALARGLLDVDGHLIPLDGALDGETVDAEVSRTNRGPRATLLGVITPSPHRVAPRCRHAAECGGCDWQHIAYEAQLTLKRSSVAELLERGLGRRVTVSPVLATTGPTVDDRGAPWGFRHKVHFVFAPGPGSTSARPGDHQPGAAGSRGRAASGLVMGHYARGSRRVVPVTECPVHAEAGNGVAFAIRDHLAALGIPGSADDGARGIARHVVVRVGHATGERVATLVVTRDDDRRLRQLRRRVLEDPAAPGGFFLNVHDRPTAWLFGPSTRHLHGRARLREEVAGVSFLVSPTAFFQTNVAAAEAIVRMVIDAIASVDARRVLDLYAGSGLFALPLARAGCEVVAVEDNTEAVEAGVASRGLNRIDTRACRFLSARAEDYVAGTVPRAGGPFAPDAIVLDPPREGRAASLVERALERWRPRLLVYVSCNPEALAADLGALARAGVIDRRGAPYEIGNVRPVDMFPHTAHVEVVATLRERSR